MGRVGVGAGDGKVGFVDVAMFHEAEQSKRGVDGLLRVEYVNDAQDWLDVIGQAADGWLVRLRFEHGEAGPHIAAIELRPSSAARDPRVGSLYVRRIMGTILDEVENLLLIDYMVSKLAGGKWRRQIRRPGRRGRPDIFYAEWAAKYVVALADDPAEPITAMVRREAAEGTYVSKAMVKAYRHRAVERGLLTDVPPGRRSGGELTAAARKLLANR